MAIAHLTIRVGKGGKAAAHAAYIAREGRYASRLARGEKLEASESGNMPAWAQSNPQLFWQAADAFERKNGSTYREMEIALPRELNAAQRTALVRDFVRQEIGDRFAYQWAIHVPRAADGQEQPHVHLMFSERQMDGIERDQEQFFKRYNAKAPERGGCKKANTGLDRETRREQLKALRSRWEVVCNRALERAGTEARIDMRSHAERGTGLEPEKKMLPSEWRRPERRAEIIEFRQARAELEESRKDLARLIPDMEAEIIDLQAERQRRVERPAPDPIQDLLGEAEALLNTGKTAKAAKQPRQLPDALQELINADKRGGRRGVSVSRPEPARAPEKAAAPAQEPKKGPPEWLRRAKEEEQRRRASWERYERDRDTEQETRPGVRHPDKPHWQVERERILTEAYNADVAEKMGRWFRIEQQGGALVLSNREATVTDHGDRVTAAAGNEREIEAMVELARAKGWEKVSLTGSAEFQEQAARAFVEAGFGLVDIHMEQRARAAIETERQRLAQPRPEPALARISEPTPPKLTEEQEVAAFLAERQQEIKRIHEEAAAKLREVMAQREAVLAAIAETKTWPDSPVSKGFLGFKRTDPNWKNPEKERERLRAERERLDQDAVRLKELAGLVQWRDRGNVEAHKRMREKDPDRFDRLYRLWQEQAQRRVSERSHGPTKQKELKKGMDR